MERKEIARELLKAREMLTEVNMTPALPMLLHADNQAVIKQLEGKTSSIKAKHIDVRVKFVCDNARRGIFLVQYGRSDQMLAY